MRPTRWQLLLVLVGFPCLYIANSYMPWSKGLFVQRDHGFYFRFWMSVAVLHWATAALTIVFVRQSGGRLADIGLDLTPRAVAAIVGVPLVIGTAFILARQGWAADEVPTSLRKLMYPAALDERLVWVGLSFSAGFCEELVYRGFAIGGLQRRGLRTWLAVLLATISFVFVHGIAGFTLFPYYFVPGLLFAALFIWRRSLVPGICLHTLVDLGAILAG